VGGGGVGLLVRARRGAAAGRVVGAARRLQWARGGTVGRACPGASRWLPLAAPRVARERGRDAPTRRARDRVSSCEPPALPARRLRRRARKRRLHRPPARLVRSAPTRRRAPHRLPRGMVRPALDTLSGLAGV